MDPRGIHAASGDINSIVEICLSAYFRGIHGISCWSELPSYALYRGFLTAERIGEFLRS